jgi:hypothetical protein
MFKRHPRIAYLALTALLLVAFLMGSTFSPGWRW